MDNISIPYERREKALEAHGFISSFGGMVGRRINGFELSPCWV
jgi:hypothetical protein